MKNDKKASSKTKVDVKDLKTRKDAKGGYDLISSKSTTLTKTSTTKSGY